MNGGLFAQAGMAVVVLAMIGVVAPIDLAGGSQGGDSRRRSFSARLHGGNETPAVFSTGRGFAVLRLNDAAETIDFIVSYSNLEGATTDVAHVHFGQTGVAGGIMFFLCGGPTTGACAPTSGTVTGTAGPADIIGPDGQGIASGEFAEALTAIRAGLGYVNVHTDKHPGGEIRGQLR
ncbi:MAG: CHRD domain-containing protein [Vicinamibacteraceae bacterium]